MSQPTVLIVDDDIDLSAEVSEILIEHSLDVKVAASRLQFEDMCRQNDFDMFIVDLLLPDGHGHDIIRQIRDKGNAGIIVLTGKLDEVDTVVSLELGADDYVVKPFSRSEFVARVKRLLRRVVAEPQVASTPSELSTEIKYGAWLTDLNARKLYSASGEEVQLTKLEFDLWLAFIQNTDRVLTRESLIISIRGRDWAGYDRAIDGLVSRLRKKLSAFGEIDAQFETIRGVGYLLRQWPDGEFTESEDQ